MKEKECTQCNKTLPIFKNVTVDGERLHLCQYCAQQYNAKNSKPKTQSTPIKKFSDKRAKRNAAYLLARDIFLMESRNHFCPVMAKVYGKTIRTNEIHHIFGREHEKLIDRDFWLPVSREGHIWIHANPKIARENKWLI